MQSEAAEVSSKIYGGRYAKKNTYRFAVFIGIPNTTHTCTGALIERKWVLTNAHCTRRGATHVFLGYYDRDRPIGTEFRIPIAESMRHPNYTVLNNDIALIRLSYPADLSESNLGKVAVVQSEAFMNKALANTKKCRLLGWGVTRGRGVWKSTSRLQYMDMKFVDNVEANARGYYYMDDWEGTMNIEAKEYDECGYGGACTGDDGGPVICKKGKKWVVVGMFNYWLTYDGCYFGIKSAVNVFLYKDWISSITGK